LRADVENEMRKAMRILTNLLALCAVAATLNAGGVHGAPASCQPATFDSVSTSIATWEKGHKTGLAAPVQQKIAAEYCESAEAFSKEKGVDISTINAVAPKVVSAFLDIAISRDEVGRTLGSVLRSEFGVPGFARPKPKEYGKLLIIYDKPADKVRLDKAEYEPYPSFLLELGKTRVSGLRASSVICSGDVEIRQSSDARFTC
ncbi:MAG: hypothetical protein ACXWJV_08160, partial [Hyphomicrobium sp.]